MENGLDQDPTGDLPTDSEPVTDARLQGLKNMLFGDLTTDQAAYVMDIDKSTVLKYLREGDLEGYQLGRSWRIPVESLRKFKDRLLEQSRTTAWKSIRATELESQCERLQRAEPEAGWETRECPYTGELILVRDQYENNEATGRKVGECGFCSVEEGGYDERQRVWHTYPGQKRDATEEFEFDRMPF